MSVQPSIFPGYDLLICTECERPIRLIAKGGSRPRHTPPLSKADLNRALRASRRMKGKHGTDLP